MFTADYRVLSVHFMQPLDQKCLLLVSLFNSMFVAIYSADIVKLLRIALDLIQFSTKMFATVSGSCYFTSTRKINLQIFGIERQQHNYTTKDWMGENKNFDNVLHLFVPHVSHPCNKLSKWYASACSMLYKKISPKSRAQRHRSRTDQKTYTFKKSKLMKIQFMPLF
jgi:hypothetical protein